MRVSVIIPCFRQGRYLRTAIDSCLAQIHRDIEVIVVNDGSDDDTDEVAREYGERIRYIHKTNAGLCAARNTGIALASGKYMKFLDADDHLAPEQITWQMESLEGSQKRVGVTTARAYQDGDPGAYRDMIPQIQNLIPDMFSTPDIPPHSWLFPSDMVREVNGFNERYSPAGDWDFVCRIGKLRPMVCCDQRVGCYYRLRTGSMSSTNHRGTTVEVAQSLLSMHEEFRGSQNRGWFGRELLAIEQATYRRLLIGRYAETELENQLLIKINELWNLTGPPSGVSRKFLALRRALGYRMAERIYARFARYRLRRAGRL